MPACARCGKAINFEAAVCPHCRFSAALGEEVSFQPPRAAQSNLDFEMPPMHRMMIKARWRWWDLAVFALVPGLGHYIDRQPRKAAWFGGGICGAVLLAMILGAFPNISMLLVAIAGGVHAWSILDHTPWKTASIVIQVVVMLIASFLLGSLWSIVLGFGSPFHIDHVTFRRGEVAPTSEGGAILFTFLMSALVLIAVFFIARWIKRRQR